MAMASQVTVAVASSVVTFSFGLANSMVIASSSVVSQPANAMKRLTIGKIKYFLMVLLTLSIWLLEIRMEFAGVRIR